MKRVSDENIWSGAHRNAYNAEQSRMVFMKPLTEAEIGQGLLTLDIMYHNCISWRKCLVRCCHLLLFP